MKIALLTSHAQKSCRELIQALGDAGHNAIQYDPFKTNMYGHHFDYIFSYGSSAHTVGAPRINSASAVDRCVHKTSTLKVLQKAGVPCPDFRVDSEKVPDTWKYVVCRKDETGRKAEGMLTVAWEDMDYYQSHLCNFFTEYFPHRNEYRVVVFRGKVVGVYHKTLKDGMHHFIIQNRNKGYDQIIESCERAAVALKIDYVGFDVVAARKDSFRILEANSGPILTQEASDSIVNFFNQL